MSIWNLIAKEISLAIGEKFIIETHEPVSGGSINAAWRISGSHKQYFVKLNSANALDMFEAESAGLRELEAAHAIRVPATICCGKVDKQSFLVLEYIELGHKCNMAAFGERIAELHRHTSSRFGWKRDNTIGSTLQKNQYSSDWITFWRELRLGFQLSLAEQNGYTGSLVSEGKRLMELLPALFADYQPAASLLHGDLWSGNYGMDTQYDPVIFDPAVYYGDREADIAMTEMFGGFDNSFYQGYNSAYPLDAGYSVRKQLYNLYHVLNHLNLFGGGYRFQADSLIGQLLSELV